MSYARDKVLEPMVFAARRNIDGKWFKLPRRKAEAIWALGRVAHPDEAQGYALLVAVRHAWAKHWRDEARNATRSKFASGAFSERSPEGLAGSFILWDWATGRINSFPGFEKLVTGLHDAAGEITLRENQGQWFIVSGSGNWGTHGYDNPKAALAAASASVKERRVARKHAQSVQKKHTRASSALHYAGRQQPVGWAYEDALRAGIMVERDGDRDAWRYRVDRGAWRAIPGSSSWPFQEAVAWALRKEGRRP